MTTAAHEYRAAADPLSTVVESVCDWSAESPCAGWTVADVLVEGKHLEGVGVEPDVRVARPIEYSQGADPQLQEAVRQAELLAAKL